MTRDELQAVVAHELSHVRNLDIRLMTVIAAMVGAARAAVGLDGPRLARSRAAAAAGRGRGKDKGGGGAIILLVIWIVAILLAPIIGQMLAMMVSRGREYLADASGAELTRNPLALASALEKIEQAHAPTASVKRGTAHLCIADPLGNRRACSRDGARPACVASADGQPHYGAATDGVSGVTWLASRFALSTNAGGAGRAAGRAQVAALLLLRVLLGVFMFFFGLEKASWLLDATPLATQLSSWLLDAPPASRWYLERIIPGAPVFARLVPLGAMLGGLALALGFWTRMAARCRS